LHYAESPVAEISHPFMKSESDTKVQRRWELEAEIKV